MNEQQEIKIRKEISNLIDKELLNGKFIGIDWKENLVSNLFDLLLREIKRNEKN